MKTIIFAILCIIYWIGIAILSMIQNAREYPGEKRGVSLIPYLIVTLLVIGAGIGMNALLRDLGYWVVGFTHGAYLTYGLACMMRSKQKKSGSS